MNSWDIKYKWRCVFNKGPVKKKKKEGVWTLTTVAVQLVTVAIHKHGLLGILIFCRARDKKAVQTNFISIISGTH